MPVAPEVSVKGYSNDEAAAALRANVAGYNTKEEKRLVAGSPHLKFPYLRHCYDNLVEASIRAHDQSAETLRVLELGAGDGLASRPWFERRIPLTAVDPSAAMLARLSARSAGAPVEVVLADAQSYVEQTIETFDVVCFVSMLHHIPDYLSLLDKAKRLLRPHGAFITFQDPMRYDRMSGLLHRADLAFYFSWRLGQGSLLRGLHTRWRRLRGIYATDQISDFEEYHVVRNGVDSAAIQACLQPRFGKVQEIRYWSSQSSLGQEIGQRLGWQNTFAILALNAR